MKNTVLVLSAMILCLSCGNDDNPLEGECQGIIDYAPSFVFLIELVDSDANNLMENGFYDLDQITASINGETFENFDATMSRDTIRLYPIAHEASNRWLLYLSETDTDTLDYSVTLKEERHIFDGALFCGTRSILNSASYNGKPIELVSEQESILKLNVTVVKSTEDD